MNAAANARHAETDISTFLAEIRTGENDAPLKTATDRYLEEMDDAWDAHCDWQAERAGTVTLRDGSTRR